MAISFVGASALSSGTGGATGTLPSGVADGDVIFLLTESRGDEPVKHHGGFEEITVQAAGTGLGSTRLGVYWTKYDSNTTLANLPDAGDHIAIATLAYRGVETVGLCYNQLAADAETGGSTSVTFPAVTTTVNDCWIVNALAYATDTATPQASGWTNSNLTSLNERLDAGTTSGDGGGIAVHDGVLATAGASGATTATLATSALQARVTLALQPSGSYSAPSGPVVESITTGSQTTNTTTHSVTLPATINAGDVLLATIAFDSNPTVTWDNSTAGSWTEKVNTNAGAATDALAIYSKTADGTEDGKTLSITTSTSEMSEWAVFRISGAEGSVEVSTVATSSTNDPHPVPNALTPSWAQGDTLWFGIIARDDPTTVDQTRAPRYAYGEVSGGTVASSPVLTYQYVVFNAATQRPGGVSLAAGETWLGATLAVRKAASTPAPALASPLGPFLHNLMR